MNYKHAFHAGNHTEVFKHSVLCLLLAQLQNKPKPFAVLDTHAAAGVYDLLSLEAKKTGEAQDGIARVFHKVVPAAGLYLDLVRRLNPGGLRLYPGSPKIVQSFLRESDRLIACELSADAAASLRAHFRDDRRVAIHHRDGYEAALAFVPPPERRGLVLIDPPFEESNELESLGNVLVSGTRKWPTGMFAAWYPIKERSATQVLTGRLRRAQIPKCLAVQLLLFPENGERLAGSGMLLCNTPWRFDRLLHSLCTDLLEAFALPTGQYSVKWLRKE
jgi:23S rRNA (adenine2030-N6)-methyltransferase